MTHRLILIRHAKSSWDDPKLEDHDRPLNGRGRDGALDIGEWLAQHDYRPDLVLCSTAARTRETWEIIENALSAQAELRLDKSLYHASAEQMLEVLQGSGSAQTVLMLGHNPGMARMAGALAGNPPHHPRFSHYPTAATTVFQFDVSDWRDVKWETGDVLDFAVPRGEA